MSIENKHIRYSTEFKNNVISEYINNKTLSVEKLSKNNDINPKTLNKWLIDSKIDLNTTIYGKRLYSINESKFNVITPESAYWIGFLMADGCVTDKNIISLKISDIDMPQLNKFKLFLESNHVLYDHSKYYHSKGQTGQHSLSFSSKQMAECLFNYGITPRKSLSAKASSDLIYNKNFWRGLIDGDGTVYIYDKRKNELHFYPRLIVNGSIDICNQFKDFICSNYPNFKGNVFKVGPIFRVSVKGEIAFSLIKYLYQNASVFLDRKMESAKNIINLGETKYKNETICTVIN